jgi:isoaspartyl peptidase/L-asparaginase-like protein (Ntn-hydrolase superfamily)
LKQKQATYLKEFVHSQAIVVSPNTHSLEFINKVLNHRLQAELSTGSMKGQVLSKVVKTNPEKVRKDLGVFYSHQEKEQHTQKKKEGLSKTLTKGKDKGKEGGISM